MLYDRSQTKEPYGLKLHPWPTPATQASCTCVETLTDKQLDNWTNAHSEPQEWDTSTTASQLSKPAAVLTAGNDIRNTCHLQRLSEEISLTPNQTQTPVRERSGWNSSKWNLSRAAKRPQMWSTRISLHLIWLLEHCWPIFKILSRQHSGCWAVADFTEDTAEYGPCSPI